MNLKVAFFCGHKSPYGLAHLAPIIDSFDVKVVILGSEQRWSFFQEKLTGKVYHKPYSDHYFLTIVKNIIKVFVNMYSRYQGRKNIQRLLGKKNIDQWEVYDINSSDFIQKLGDLNVDLCISAAYPQIFSRQILEIPKLGAINFHPSLLPRYRGAHPHFWQIVNGEREGGITAHFMTENIDNGDVIAQIAFPIDDCTYSELYKKIIEHTPRLVEKVHLFFEEQKERAIPQKTEDASYYKNDREIHTRIFWNLHSSQDIHNLIRTGKAFCFFNGIKVIFCTSYIAESNRNLTNNVRVESGTIVDFGKDSMAVKTMDGCINIKELKVGRKKMSYLHWAKIKNASIGEKFD